jgi:hypothetical protein
LPQLAGDIVVPLGNAGDIVYTTFSAFPDVVIVNVLARPLVASPAVVTDSLIVAGADKTENAMFFINGVRP